MSTRCEVISTAERAVFGEEKMGKSTLFHSERILVGLNTFEPGQEHRLHTHEGMDKVYYVTGGRGLFLTEEGALPMKTGDMLAAPEGAPHGIRNDSEERLTVLAVLAPSP